MKDPYLQERASKLDSATGVADIKYTIADMQCNNGGIRPNEEGPVIFDDGDDSGLAADMEGDFTNWLDDENDKELWQQHELSEATIAEDWENLTRVIYSVF